MSDSNVVFDFGYALGVLKRGGKVARKGWNGKGLWIELQRPDDDDSKMTTPYAYITGVTRSPLPGSKTPWVPSQSDLWANDWVAL